jgi:Protein of unknown function (DUF2637)
MSLTTITVATIATALVVFVVVSVRTRGHRTPDKRTPDKGADMSARSDKGADTGFMSGDMSGLAKPGRTRRLILSVAAFAGAATMLLTVASFVLSYAHLQTVAVRNGVPAGFHAWVWPGTIDTFILVGEALILFCAVAGLGRSLWGWGLTIGGSFGSIGFNVLGVGSGASRMEYAVAGAPPVAALFAFGALMHMVRMYVRLVSERPDTVSAVVSDVSDVVSVRTPDKAPDTVSVRTPDKAPDTVSVRTSDKPSVRPDVSGPDTLRTPDKPSDTVSAQVVRPDMSVGQADIGQRTPDKPSDTVSAPAVRPIGEADVSVRTSDKPADKAADKRTRKSDKAVDPVRAARVRRVRKELDKGTYMTGDKVAGMFEGITPRTGQRILAEARAA